jgi:hypothetical protein
VWPDEPDRSYQHSTTLEHPARKKFNMNLKTNAKAKGSMPNKKAKYPSRSTAAKTKMLTVCKRCGKQNDNGYQYCTACHKAHKGRNGKTIATRAVQIGSTATSTSSGVASQVSPVDPDEVLKVAANEL